MRTPRLPGFPGGRPLARRSAARGSRTAARGVRRGLPPTPTAPRTRAPLSGRGSPPTSIPEGAAPTRSPRLFPLWLGLSGADAGPGVSSHPEPAAHRYPHRRRRPPPAPFLADRPWSSFAWLPPEAARNLARSWGLSGSGTTALGRGRRPGGDGGARLAPGSGAAVLSPRSGKPSPSGRRPEP